MPLRPPHPEPWELFRERVFGSTYMIWHDGLNTYAVTSLEGDDRAYAIEMLRKGLAEKDPAAAEALGAMGAKETIDELEALIARNPQHESAVRAANALLLLNGEPGDPSPHLRVLRSTGHWSDKLTAVISIRSFRHPKWRDAITETLLDVVRGDERTLRGHALTSVCTLWGLTEEGKPLADVLCGGIGVGEGPATDEERAGLERVVRRVREAIARVAQR